MHSISFGAEGDNSVEVVSVKILLKQAYSAHLAKVRSLENELKELRETLLEISKSDKSECNRCKEAGKALDLCKQEYASALDEQKKRFESLAQKVILLENRNASVHESNSIKQDAVSKNSELHLESPPRKQVLANISTNIGLPVEKSVDVHSNLGKVAKANDKSSNSVASNTDVMLYSSLSPKSKTGIEKPVNQKDFFSSLQSSFLDHSSNDSDIVLVTETLDVLDEVPKKDTNENKSKKESNVAKGKPAISLKDANEGKENIFDGTKSVAEKSSGKRRSPGAFSENEQAVKKYKSTGCKEALTGNGKFCEEKVSNETDQLCAKSKDSSSLSGKDDPSTAKADDLSNFSVGSTFFDVDPSFLDQKSVLNNSKKSKTQSPTKKHKAPNPSVVITHDDDADFQISLSTASKKGDESGTWKTSKKNLKKSANASGVKTTSKFKMTLEAPSLNFRKPKYKQTKLSKSIFHPSQTTATDSIILSEKDDVAEDCSSNAKSGVKEDNSNHRIKGNNCTSKVKEDNIYTKVKEGSSDSTAKANSDNGVKEDGANRSKETTNNSRLKDIGNRVKCGNGNKVKEVDGNNSAKDNNVNKVKEVDGNNSAKDNNVNKVKEVSGNIVKENNDNRETEKDSHNDSETIAWEEGTFTYSEMERWERGSFSSSEVEKLRNTTVDVDATFVPDHMLQNFDDSVPDVVGASNVTEGLVEQEDQPINICDKDESFSSDFIEEVYKQKAVHEESCTNQHSEYQIQQYPEKKLLKPPSSKTEKQKCNSFDRVPSPEVPNYKFKEDPVRCKDKRQQLKGFDCKECEKYYSALGLSDEEKKERLKQCSRHRATHVPPATPANFWELDFPDTQECRERGYVGDTQKVALKSRRRRPLK